MTLDQTLAIIAIVTPEIRRRTQLALEILNALDTTISPEDRTVYAAQLLEALNELTTSPLEITRVQNQSVPYGYVPAG